MPEFFREFLSWYLAPWRRIPRKEFGVALTLATIPSLIIMFFGFGNSAGSFIEPLMNLSSISQTVGQGSADDLNASLEALTKSLPSQGQVGTASSSPAYAFDWSGFLNGICLLLMIPLVRMRLRDMGWFGWHEVAFTVLFNISVVEGFLQSVSGVDILPMGMLWSVVNFIGYAWLMLAKSAERLAMHERVMAELDARDNADQDPLRKREFDDDY